MISNQNWKGGGGGERNKRRPVGSFLKNCSSHLFWFNKWVYNGLLKPEGETLVCKY